MLPLETKQSGGKLLPHSDLQGGSVSRGGTTQQATEKGHCFRWMELAEDRDRWRALVSPLRCVIPVVCVTNERVAVTTVRK